MKKFFVLMFAGLMFASPLFAVEYLNTLPDGSQIYRCESRGDDYKVRVKYRGRGRYTVLRFGSGTMGRTGEFTAKNHAHAATFTCNPPR